MGIRRNKRRIYRLLQHRLTAISHLEAEMSAWDQIVPVGREFGSPDFERLLQEDVQRWNSERLAQGLSKAGPD